MRSMLAAIDHNMHLFRQLKKNKDGEYREHRKYSKRTKRYHAQSVKEDKQYKYHSYLVCKMLQERRDFIGCANQKIDDNVFHPKHIHRNLGMKDAPPTKELVKGPSRFNVKPK